MIGSYLQIFNDNPQPEKVLFNFRKIYPDSPIYLVSDAGADFSELAKKYNCFYEHAEINTGIYYFNLEKIKIWLKRFKNCFEYCKGCEYILYLEDDVLVRKPFEMDGKEIYGVMAEKIPTPFIEYFQNKYKVKFNSHVYGTCGGAVFKRQVFLDMYETFLNIIEENYDYMDKNITYKFGYLDLFMPLLYMSCGYTYYENYNLIESARNKNWKTTNHAIVHGKQIHE